LFHLWEAAKADYKIVQQLGVLKLPRDGKPVGFDFRTGRQGPADFGHITLICRSESGTGKPGEKFRWELVISAPNGGIKAGSKELNFEAPLEGYSPSVQIVNDPKDPGWKLKHEHEYFLRLSDGSFARISIHIYGHSGVASFESFLNTSGSRRLEPPTSQ
jgi:hypothetical protein